MLTVKAAAIQDAKGAIYSLPQPNRHFNIMTEVPGIMPDDERGFLLNDGRFVDRVEAKRIARAAGQLRPDASNLPKLYSDEVW